jgi:hypothetical protein
VIAGKLVEQILIRRKIEQGRYPTGEAYEKALAEYNITDSEARLQLQRQITLVSFIDVRFGPEVQLKDAGIQDYYNSTYPPDGRLDRWLRQTRIRLHAEVLQ